MRCFAEQPASLLCGPARGLAIAVPSDVSRRGGPVGDGLVDGDSEECDGTDDEEEEDDSDDDGGCGLYKSEFGDPRLHVLAAELAACSEQQPAIDLLKQLASLSPPLAPHLRCYCLLRCLFPDGECGQVGEQAAALLRVAAGAAGGDGFLRALEEAMEITSK